ncbi:UDP-glucose dehydrogenase family protein [Caminibacter pacificus]|uniref:UDP-glucose 6-dehydrogenase n=1 Tax=Caminibacter pacificus TaxID=1424653 RepID=A0AAJ4RCW1_9BACT|nr:UDP-glucose/GDP-mannose dehydrogenase family protein [Caminibacter pacificus]QCI27759.1 UDP-glucose/GDP-mannose dehydrogenase family protein [Caminibacter pacificus]ROR40066.1 GDP-mannose 6-dehydrogenase [Caminibacter pacificus]
MRISVVGLGYVGAVCSAALANEGHQVIGMDIDKTKVELINEGKSPIVEKDLDVLIEKNVKEGRLRATTNLKEAIENSDITFIAVGTPSRENGSIDLKYIKEAAKSIGEVLKDKKDFHIVVMRSTVLPGTGKGVVIPIIEENSGKKVGVDFGYASNPEFLRESTAIWDFYHPPKTVIGASDEKTANTLEELYSFIDTNEAPLFKTEIETAEMVKYADNSWHAVKVTFGNEIGMICSRLGIDSHKVMKIFCADRKLNISCYYLTPGFAFGGSCLPKDVKALTYKAKEVDEKTPLLNSLMESNEYQIKRVFNHFIKPLRKKKVGILGLSFKAGTDDLRESPILELTETLIGKGYFVKIFDENVVKAREEGAAKEFLETELHHINERLTDNLQEVIDSSEILVIGNKDNRFKGLADKYKDKIIIDVAAIEDRISQGNYFRIV